MKSEGQLLYTLGDGQWDIPALRTLLEKILPDESVLDGYEVEHEFPKIGRRTMLLNARTVVSESNAHMALLLAIGRGCSASCKKALSSFSPIAAR
jgi:hypothetical protein